MKTLFDAAAQQELTSRVNNLSENSPRKFGTMNAPQMLHHVNLALRAYLGEVPMHYRGNFIKAFIFKRLTFSPIPIPPGKGQTAPALMAHDTYDLELEKKTFRALVKRVGDLGPSHSWPVHEFFGPMTGDQYGKLGYKHTDHHFRQFGI